MSRSGNECVVALTDQWYIKYGEKDWKAQVDEHLQTDLNCYSEDTKLRFEVALSWLSEWGCSRSFGLGTKLPWDKQFVIIQLMSATREFCLHVYGAMEIQKVYVNVVQMK
jgi:leucyl-tRNA synthetase